MRQAGESFGAEVVPARCGHQLGKLTCGRARPDGGHEHEAFDDQGNVWRRWWSHEKASRLSTHEGWAPAHHDHDWDALRRRGVRDV